jgi:outer membrane autotransporter protein
MARIVNPHNYQYYYISNLLPLVGCFVLCTIPLLEFEGGPKGETTMAISAMRARIGAMLCAAAALCAATGARAQTGFTAIQAFGDSYADTGNIFRLIGPLPQYPTGRFSGGTNFVDATSQLLGIPQFNFAEGGALTGSVNQFGAGLPGFAQEWQGFLAAGGRIAPTDLVEINIGFNDARAYYMGGGTLAGVSAAATQSAQQAQAGVNALVGAGARNIVFTAGDVSIAPEAAGVPSAAIGSAFSQNYNSQMQVALAAIARSGVRVEYVDFDLVAERVKANPAAFGISNVGACPLSCLGNPALQNQFLFYLDDLHLTSHGFAILGEYIVNRLNAPLTFAPQGDLALTSAGGFAATLFGRLDMFSETSALASVNAHAQVNNALYSKAPYMKAPAPAVESAWSFYMLGNGGLSDRASTVSSTGYKLDSVGGTIGTEYRINANAFIGGAFDYSNPKARLLNNSGTTDVNSYQFGLYGAAINASFFVQALVTFGWQDYRNTRPGVIDEVTSNPEGTTFVAAGKVGYLFDLWQGQVGPIGGLTYARAHIDSYSESGDALLTLTVGKQTAETLVGSIGAQFRRTFVIDDRAINPYLNLTLEDDLLGNSREIQFDATSAPLIVNNWSIPGNSQRVYGRIAGGVSAPISDNLAVTVNLSRTLGRDGGDDFYGNGGLKISF